MAKTQTTADVLQERGSRYGEFKSHAIISTRLNHFIADDLENLIDADGVYTRPVCVEATKMIHHKSARILNGDQYYDDSWRDIAGYAKLGAENASEILAMSSGDESPTADYIYVDLGEFYPELNKYLGNFESSKDFVVLQALSSILLKIAHLMNCADWDEILLNYTQIVKIAESMVEYVQKKVS